MTKESERPRFRGGENANRPIGGHVAYAPFARALRDLAVDRGHESQSSLARFLEKKQGVIGNWIADKHIPSPEEFGNIIIKLQPNDEKMEKLVKIYAEEVGRGRGISWRVRPETRIKIYEAVVKHSDSPLGQWVENFCSTRGITLGQWFRTVGLTAQVSMRGNLGLENLSRILENTQVAFGLSEEETKNLSETVVLEIQQRLEKGKRFQDSPSGHRIKKMQENLACRSYNGSEAAVELGVTRATVSNLRKEFGLPYLLTEENLKMLKEHLEKKKVSREKFQQSMLKRRTGNLGETDLTIFQ